MRRLQSFIASLCSAAITISGPATSATVRGPDNPSSSRVGCDLSKHATESAYLHAIQVKAAPSGSIDVRVHEGKAPVVLLLSSEQPVRWNVKEARGAEVQRVILLGNGSDVLGLQAGTRLSRCGKSDGLVPFRIETVDHIADALELSIAGLARHRIAGSKGYDVIASEYPDFNPNITFDRCRIDFDYGGYGITRRDVSTAHACRAVCDTYGAANRWQGRTVCVFNGATLKAYSPQKPLEGRSCRLLTPSGRNIRSYPAQSETECRETVCYVGTGLWERDKERRGSLCRFRGRTIERHGL